MNTVPWDTHDSIKRSYSLLLCCMVFSILLHLAFFVYFDSLEKSVIDQPKEQLTTLNISLKTASNTPIKPKKLKPAQKIAEKKPLKQKTKSHKKTLTAKKATKPDYKNYSALEKIAPTPVPVKKPKKEKEEHAYKAVDKTLEKTNEKESDQTQLDTAKRINEKKVIEYRTLLEQWLNNYKKYPLASKKRKQEGIVVVSFTLNAEGQLLSHEIKEASDHRLLNKAVVKMLKKANPMPAIPKDIRGNKTRFSYTIPVAFYLNRL